MQNVSNAAEASEQCMEASRPAGVHVPVHCGHKYQRNMQAPVCHMYGLLTVLSCQRTLEWLD